MKKFRSKKGLTLVELVVTVAILGIVSGFSITIVVTAMNNYTEAAIVKQEQDEALMIEEYIVRHARVASQVSFVNNDDLKTYEDEYPDSVAPDKTKAALQGYYIAKVGTTVETFDYAKEDLSTGEYNFGSPNPEKYTTLVYDNVGEITVSFERQKTAAADTKKKCSYYMNYYIKMHSGYVLRGQVVMNNANMEYMDNLAGPTKGVTTALVDQLKEYNLIKIVDNYTTYSVEPAENCAIMFK